MIETAFVLGLITALGGATLFGLYLAAGGARRARPDRSLAGLPAEETSTSVPANRQSRWTLARVGLHGAGGVIAVVFLGVGAASDDLDRQGAVIGAVVAVVAAVVGVTLVRQWAEDRRRGEHQRPEQRLPAAIVAVHGLAAAATVVCAVIAVFTIW